MTTSHPKPFLKLRASHRWLTLAAGLTLVGGAVGTMTIGVIAAPEVPILVQAYKAAEKNPDKPGIKATITLTGLSSSVKPKVMVAQGALKMEGDLLGARLPLSLDGDDSSDHILFFNVSRTGRVGLQWLEEGKPYKGESMKAFDTVASGSTLTKRITWQGGSRQLTVTLDRGLILLPGVIKLKPTPKPIIIGGIKLKPTPTPTPKLIVIPGKIKKAPKGRNVKVSTRFVVTNSDDGVGGIFGNSDKQVELAGSINIGSKSVVKFNNRKAEDGSEFTNSGVSFALTYSDPDHRFTKISGQVWDVDKASARDTLWIASQTVDLIKIMESNQEYVIRGDRKSESGDLYIRVIDQGEFK